MKPRIAFLFLALLGTAVLVEGTRVERRALGVNDLWRAASARIAPEIVTRLQALEEPLDCTLFVTARERMPSHLKHLEEHVVRKLEDLERTSDGKLRFRVVDPSAQDATALREHAGRLGVSPGRTRRIERDGILESEVYATLRLTLGARPAALIEHVRPEHLPLLPEWIVAQADALRDPPETVIGLDAPSGFDELRSALDASGKIVELDLAADGRIPAEVDVIYWLEPERVEAPQLAAIERFMERGGDLVVAASPFDLATESTPLGPRGRVRRGAFGARGLWSALGLRATKRLLLDTHCGELRGESGPVAAPWIVRSIAPNQDFRGLGGQPNGHLLFAAAAAIELDALALHRRGVEARILASTSVAARAVEADPDVPLVPGALDSTKGDPLPGTSVGRRALAVWLEPGDPRRGRVFAFGASTPFRDRMLSATGFAHAPLLGVLMRTTGTLERNTLRRAARRLPAPLAPLSDGARQIWRALVVLLLPAGLIAARGVARLRQRRSGTQARKRRLRPALASLALLVAVLLLGTVSGRLRTPLTDWSAGRSTYLPEATGAELRRLMPNTQRIDVELIFSPDPELPAQFRGRMLRARESADRFARADERIHVKRKHPADLDAAARARLESAGAGVRTVEFAAADERRVAEVVGALRLVAIDDGGVRNELILSLGVEAELEDFDLKLLLGLQRLAGKTPPRVAWMASTPRLSPAEALLDFQNRGLFAPTEGDVYQRARRLLVDHGIALDLIDADKRLETSALELPELIIWMQPRRSARNGIERISHTLHAGGAALVFAQHFEILSRKLEGEDLALAFWPQPQFPDISRFFLEPFGIALERSLFFDALHTNLPVWTRIDSAGVAPRYVLEEQTQAFHVRASASAYPKSAPIVHGLGDLLFPSGNRITHDEQRVREQGLVLQALVRSSDDCWTLDWQGGDLPAAVLSGDNEAVDRLDAPQDLAVLIEGRFPELELDSEDDGMTGFDGPRGEQPGGFLLCSSSQAFENPWLSRAGFRQDRFLLASVAELALGPGASALFERGPDPGGLGLVEPNARARWRLAVLALGPLGLLLLEGLRRLVARVRRPSAGGVL